MTAWQPIETAPKDGTVILTWGCLHDDGGVDMGEKPYVRLAYWFKVQGRGWWHSDSSGSHEPTHWMPLPEPPKPE